MPAPEGAEIINNVPKVIIILKYPIKNNDFKQVTLAENNSMFDKLAKLIQYFEFVRASVQLTL